MPKYVYVIQTIFVCESVYAKKSYSSIRNDGVITNWEQLYKIIIIIDEQLDNELSDIFMKQYEEFCDKYKNKSIQEIMDKCDILDIVTIDYKNTDTEYDSETFYLSKIPIIE